MKAEELEKYHELLEKGIISRREFERKKKEILSSEKGQILRHKDERRYIFWIFLLIIIGFSTCKNDEEDKIQPATTELNYKSEQNLAEDIYQKADNIAKLEFNKTVKKCLLKNDIKDMQEDADCQCIERSINKHFTTTEIQQLLTKMFEIPDITNLDNRFILLFSDCF